MTDDATKTESEVSETPEDAGVDASRVEPERDLFGNTPKGRLDWSHRRGEPRGLALGWTVYLMVSSMVAFGPSAMAAADPTAYRPAAVKLVVLVAVGLFVLWPLVRLSQAWPKSPVRSAVVDSVVLLSPAMLLVWPHVILAWWPVEVAGALTVLLFGWMAMASALIVGLSAGRDEGRVRERVGGLGVWFGVVLVLPAVALALDPVRGLAAEPGKAFGGAGWMVSPLTGVYDVARDRAWSGRPAQVSGEHWRAIGMVWVAAGLVWAWAGVRRAAWETRDDADAGDTVEAVERGDAAAAEAGRA